jgi:excisionase family DNA binding protein
MSELPDDRLFGKPELAAYLGLSVSGVTKLLDDGRGPAALRVGRLVRFRRSDVMAWLEVQRFHFGMRAKL